MRWSYTRPGGDICQVTAGFFPSSVRLSSFCVVNQLQCKVKAVKTEVTQKERFQLRPAARDVFVLMGFSFLVELSISGSLGKKIEYLCRKKIGVSYFVTGYKINKNDVFVKKTCAEIREDSDDYYV
jgi:hypothetical protein